MAVRNARTFQPVSSRLTIVLLERYCELIGHITLDAKCAGARSAGNPHAACDAAGAGDGATETPKRARRGKPRTQPRRFLRATAPVPDPTRKPTGGISEALGSRHSLAVGFFRKSHDFTARFFTLPMQLAYNPRSRDSSRTEEHQVKLT